VLLERREAERRGVHEVPVVVIVVHVVVVVHEVVRRRRAVVVVLVMVALPYSDPGVFQGGGHWKGSHADLQGSPMFLQHPVHKSTHTVHSNLIQLSGLQSMCAAMKKLTTTH
jgi:hypothetical protein